MTDLGNAGSDILRGFLDNYGLGALATWAWEKYKAGESPTQIMLEARQTDTYRARFPAMETLAKSGRALTEGEYVSYERTIAGLAQQYDIPAGMYDTPAAIAKLLTNDVSAEEASDRMKMAAAAASQVPQEVRDSLSENYSVGYGSLTAYFLDPDKALPKIQANYVSAQIQAASRIQKVGTSIQTAERLAAQGVTMAEAQEGFGKVRAAAGLESGYGESVTRAQTEEAAFGTGRGGETLARVVRNRTAAFQAGGGAAESGKGVTGLSEAGTT